MRNYLTLFLLMFSSILFAQDVIVKKDGSTILSKVYEIGKKEIKYKKFSNLNGPLYNISIKEVFSVNYENGEKDLFDKIEEIEESQYETVETNGFYKKETNMYSNFSVGYVNFGVLYPSNIDFLNYSTNGFCFEYYFGIKPFNKIQLYTEIGLNATCTFGKDVEEVYFEDDLCTGGGFSYVSLRIPLNIKYKFYISNKTWAISPFVGCYVKQNITAKQKNNVSEVDLINGFVRFTYYDNYDRYVEEVYDFSKYRKTQLGFQLGLTVEYKNFNISGYYSRDFQKIYHNTYSYQFGFNLGYRLDM